MPSVSLPHNYKPRNYQLNILKAIDSGYKRAVIVWHRRSGKEKTCISGIVSRKMLDRVGSYYYVFPEFAQGRKVVWDGMDRDGFKFLDHFPKELLDGKPNDTEMKLKYKNGSVFQVIGSDRYNSVMGTNPIGMVFSEYSLQDPACWGYFRPILAENGGWAIFNFTPRGENHAFDLYKVAKADPKNWFCELLTVDDTGVVSKEILEKERSEIITLYGNDAMFLQEYYCTFSVPIAGAYYAEHIMKAYRDGRVGNVPHEPRLSVDTWWDLGINDRMSIWFTQSVGQEIRVIDFMEGTGQGFPYYIAKMKEKGYIFGRHTAPHDIEVRELTNGKSRKETAAALGVNFDVAPRLPIYDGIDAVRGIFPKLWFDSEKCKDGLNALKNYRKQYDEKRKTYLNNPFHDWTSNAADALRTLATSHDIDYKSGEAIHEDKYARNVRRRSSLDSSPMGVLG